MLTMPPGRLAAPHRSSRRRIAGLGTGVEMLPRSNRGVTVVPDWLREQCPPAWAERYGRPQDEYRVSQDAAARHALALQIGAAGRQPFC